MGNRSHLGEFEHMVLAAILRIDDGAYGKNIIETILKETGRRVTTGSLSVTLDRLEAKGYVHCRLGEPSPDRGGRPKRFAAVTREGAEAVREARRGMLNLWRGLEPELDES